MQAALDLMADTPLHRVSTRSLAKQVGISQPALFRHFRSRDAIAVAVVNHVRQSLSERLSFEPGALSWVSAALGTVASYAEEHPGLPRLLFADVAEAQSPELRSALSSLVDMMRSLVAHAVREAQEQRKVPPEVDAARAARLVVATLQGLLLQWEQQGRCWPLAPEVAVIVEVWDLGLQRGLPGQDCAPDAPDDQQHATADLDLQHLDVRPLLARGTDPFEAIQAALKQLSPDGLLSLTAPFEPRPLTQVLRQRGYRVGGERQSDDTWRVEIQREECRPPLDLRDRPAPEPLEAVLALTPRLQPGQALIARFPRLPELLLPHLDRRGLRWVAQSLPDDTALLHIRRPL